MHNLSIDNIQNFFDNITYNSKFKSKEFNDLKWKMLKKGKM